MFIVQIDTVLADSRQAAEAYAKRRYRALWDSGVINVMETE